MRRDDFLFSCTSERSINPAAGAITAARLETGWGGVVVGDGGRVGRADEFASPLVPLSFPHSRLADVIPTRHLARSPTRLSHFQQLLFTVSPSGSGAAGGGRWGGGLSLVAPPPLQPLPPSAHPTVNEWVCHAANNLHSSCLICDGPLLLLLFIPPLPSPPPSSTAAMRKSRSRRSRSNGGSGENRRKTGLLLDLGQRAVEEKGTLSPIFLTSRRLFFLFIVTTFFFLLLLSIIMTHPPHTFPSVNPGLRFRRWCGRTKHMAG